MIASSRTTPPKAICNGVDLIATIEVIMSPIMADGSVLFNFVEILNNSCSNVELQYFSDLYKPILVS